MRAKEAVATFAAAGSAAQASVPGAYAWAVTVAPLSWSRAGTVVSKVAAVAALAALIAGWWGERRWGGRARVASLWAFILACALAWSAAPGAIGPVRFDVLRGVTGTFAWALFAFAWAGPAFHGPAEQSRVSEDDPLAPRKRVVGKGFYMLVGGGVAAALIQAIGWDVQGVERALLVRLVGLAAGLAVIDTFAEVALTQYQRRSPGSAAARLRAARPALVLLAVLAVLAVAFISKG
jgi:hypothetical protein